MLNLYIIPNSSVALFFGAIKLLRISPALSEDNKPTAQVKNKDTFFKAPDEKEEINPDKLLEMQTDEMCKKCCLAIEVILKDPDNAQLLNDIRNAAENNDSKKLGESLAKFASLVKLKIPELLYDQAGFDGNQLRAYIDTTKCHQFRCDEQAKIVLEIFKHLQSKEKSLKKYEFRATGDLLDDHIATSVFFKSDKKKSEPTLVIDSWISESTETPKIFLSADSWKKEVRKFIGKEIKEQEQFNDSFKDKSDEKYNFYEKRAKENPKKLRGIPSQDDYMFFKYLADPNSNIRFAIKPDYFELMRDKFLYYSSDLKLTEKEKKELLSLSIRGKTETEQKQVWKAFDKYISSYFLAMYPKHEDVQKKFKKS